MIQRQQSLWLLLSAVCAFLSFQLPFFTGSRIVDNLPMTQDLDGASNFFFIVVTGAILILSIITIFMFKDRKLQLRLCFVGIALSVLLIVLYFVEMRKFQSGSVSLSCLFVFAILVGWILAARGIRKDEKLVKSLDKLR